MLIFVKRRQRSARWSFAGGDDDAGVDFRTFQEATWSTYALVHMLVRFSTPSRGSSEKSARVQQIWNRLARRFDR